MKALSLIGLIIITYFNTAHAQVVTLDYYFNHEVHKTSSGKIERYHYMWNDSANTGFSKLGKIFRKNGAQLDTLATAPTVNKLKKSDIYIIVDPDTKKESPNPNYIEQKDITEIAKWVHSGGVLLMLANDSANVELPHFNNLAAVFGMHFNDDLQNHVIDDKHFEDGAVYPVNNPILKTAHKIFLKDVCSISTLNNAMPALKNKNGATIIAIAKYGKGMVMAVGDPWVYNEYVNGRLPADYENDKAADDVVKWLISNTQLKHKYN
ncbi:unsaturated rhamnogalacturonyl hydrolase [Mucilaginibacter frigoritolerans]|uniref:Unsaturated rhamnogalacturonyl hydrolase n=1 Tax=Mucilaginibacter frigoritolerans TaxID=652788 RepID=A0A562TR70_9SPHI|nr:lacto-N-biose phosphorylase central domain-containing protein [Mucilaginibacter frigoritolerans]TWI95566.1 unsaturated rhamnogalacturonyl hydrolase [Mucilaginibacter frigoritolerans]